MAWRERLGLSATRELPASLTGALRPPRVPTGRPRATGEYMTEISTGVFAGWKPYVREPADEHREAWHDATARAIATMHNSGWLAGGIEQAVNAICGPQLALNARPDPDLFGGPQASADWARSVERRFAAWASAPFHCDLYGRQSLGQMCAQGTKQWFGTGEIVGVVRFRQREGNTHGTKIMLLPSKRIPFGARDPNAVQGIVLDADGCPVKTCFEVWDWRQPAMIDEIVVANRDEMGRPQVIHIHDSPATAIRGITPLAPALRVVRQFDQLANATLTSALIQAIFAATLESAMPSDQAFQALQSVDEQTTPSDGHPDRPAETVSDGSPFGTYLSKIVQWYQHTRLDVGQFGKVTHTFPGEALKFHTNNTPNATYRDFTRFLLREIAKCIGITYEQLTGDREGATYSSERMGGAEAWLTVLHRRRHIAGRLMQIAYEAWLEEDIETGGTPFPDGIAGFLAQRDRASAADWRGPPRPTADDLKTAKANEVKLAKGIITLEHWCAEEGLDWEDVLEQRLREQERKAELGVEDPAPATPAPGRPEGGGNTPEETFDDDERAPPN